MLLCNANWPKKPYCSNKIGFIRIRIFNKALDYLYIQPNPIGLIFRLVFDVDRQGASIDWADRNLPAPNWSACNPKNGHAHLGYELEVPVSGIKSIKFAKDIENSYIAALDADPGYSGILCQNPFHKNWRIMEWRKEPYSLNELSEYVRIKNSKPKEIGIGRNVTLFNTVRKWSYREIKQYWKRDFHEWQSRVISEALEVNQKFEIPLPFMEVKSTARSIARWSWKRITEEDFSKIQSARRAIKPKVKQEITKLREQGMSIREIALSLSISPISVNRYV